MRIFIISYYFAELNHEVSVVTVNHRINKPIKIYKQNQVNVVTIRSGKIEGENYLFRAFNEFFLSWKIWKHVINRLNVWTSAWRRSDTRIRWPRSLMKKYSRLPRLSMLRRSRS